jgi:peptidoglycan L-alanyl-D-glutamate endopeptidase CwlK
MTMKIADKTVASEILEAAELKGEDHDRQLLDSLLAAFLRKGGDKSGGAARVASLIRTMLDNTGAQTLQTNPMTVTKGPEGTPPLTPINAALGETIGKAMNGKKSVTGISGLLLTMLLPKIGVSGELVQFLIENQDLFVTLFSLLTGWGLFGKLDKAIRLMGLINETR